MQATEGTTPPDAMGRFRRWAAIAVAIAALGWVGYALFRGFSDTASELSNFAWTWYIAVLALTLVNYGLRYLKWHYLLGQLDVHVPHRYNLWIFLSGLAMVISPAKAGEVVKPYLVRVVSGAPMAKTIPALIAERITDGIAVVVLAAIGVTTYAADASGLIWATLGTIMLGIAALSVQPLVHSVLSMIGSVPKLSGVAQRLTEAYDAMRTVLAPVPLMFTIILSLVAWFAECVGYWFVFKGLGVAATLDQSTFLYAFSTVFGAPSPGGMGMADLALSEGALSMIHGITPGQALAASLLVRVATLWFGVVLGAFALLRMEQVIEDARAVD